MAQVQGADRNQGVFVVDAGGLRAIAMGCGGGGGSGDPGTRCGDPSPIGGTFTGFFLGTVFAPDMNDRGDVLFMADVDGGEAGRGLFLYRAAEGEIVKVAAPGDPSPLGGSFGAVGPGSLNGASAVSFLASRPGRLDSDVFVWRDGTIVRYVAAGDPAPGGGEFAFIGTQSVGLVDETSIPVGPIPRINDSGEISFRGIVSGGLAQEGLFVSHDGVHDWVVQVGDATPAGGTYADFDSPILNNNGQLAFTSIYRLDDGTLSGAWFAGSPGHWRKALGFLDVVDGGEVYGLAVSANPMRPFDDDGNLLLWCDLSSGSGVDRLIVVAAEGSTSVVARRNEIAPLGGILAELQPWPSFVGNRATLGARTPGSQALDAQIVIETGPGFARTWYRDDDGDGHGDPTHSQTNCEQPTGYAPIGDDCDDTNTSVHPGAAEVCDGVDDDCDGTANGEADCIRDLAIVSIKAPVVINMSRSASQTKTVSVTVQNRGPRAETVGDEAALDALLHLRGESLGGCPSPQTVLNARGIRFPLTLASKAKVNVAFEVTFQCVNDPARSAADRPGHEDYIFNAFLTRSALDGALDSHPLDDMCPRSVSPPYVLDPYPDGRIQDKGCGGKKPDRTFGLLVRTDLFVKGDGRR